MSTLLTKSKLSYFNQKASRAISRHQYFAIPNLHAVSESLNPSWVTVESRGPWLTRQRLAPLQLTWLQHFPHKVSITESWIATWIANGYSSAVACSWIARLGSENGYSDGTAHSVDSMQPWFDGPIIDPIIDQSLNQWLARWWSFGQWLDQWNSPTLPPLH